MNVDEYVADEAYNRCGNDNRLIDDTGDELCPNDLLTSPNEILLAEIATVIHKNAPNLEPEQLEQAVRWLKAWKHKNNPERPQSRSVWDYYSKLDELRDAGEQRKLQNKALVQLAIAGLFGSAFLATVVVTVVTNYSDAPLGWGWKAFNMLLVLLFGAGWNKFTTNGLMMAKEQDRKYLMASIRAATTAAEVSASGLFAYLPGTVWEEGQKGDDALAHKTMRAAREQLTDALYHDPDDHLGPLSTFLRR